MTYSLLHHLLTEQPHACHAAVALHHQNSVITYGELIAEVNRVAAGLQALITAGDRVALYLPKSFETVIASFAVSAAGGVLVPINPVLKPAQVQHIVEDSGSAVLISQQARLNNIGDSSSLKHRIAIDDETAEISWKTLGQNVERSEVLQSENDLAALLYTSGSTGMPKGVMLSHKNLLLGAKSVAEYLNIQTDDRILAVLPFSFDYGFNQLLSAFHQGAQCVLLDYLFPKDIVNACERYQITALAGVPPLWAQLAKLNWPKAATASLRLFTNSGGHLSHELLQQLQNQFVNAEAYLMYGLTEAFRSSYLPPAQLADKPESMGIAIPGAALYVLREDGTECDANEKGELVHAGDLVAQGYWQQPEKTAARFKPLPKALDSDQTPAVWSGDTVYRDEDGFLFFCGRNDNQIKVSGYRISPEEIEACLLHHELIEQAAVFGVPDEQNGQAITAVIQADSDALAINDCIRYCRINLAAYMLPSRYVIESCLPTNANGKLDRSLIAEQYL